MRKHHTKQEQEDHIRRWCQEGLSKNAYALKAGINPRTFIGWTWLKAGKKKTSFVEIPKKVYRSEVQEMIIEKAGIKILLPITIDTEFLKNIFTALGGVE